MFIRKQDLCVLVLLSSSFMDSYPTWSMDLEEDRKRESINYLREVIVEVDKIIPNKRERGIALIGPSKSGKSTLFNYLCDVPLCAIKQGGGYAIEVEKESGRSPICHQAASGTTHPVICGDYYDFAGFQTLPGGNVDPLVQDIVNAYALYKLLNNTKKIKFFFVTREEDISTIAPSIQQLVEMFPFTDITRGLCLVVTNRRDTVPEKLPEFIGNTFQEVSYLTEAQRKIITFFSQPGNKQIATFDYPHQGGLISDDNKEEIKRAINTAEYLKDLKPKISIPSGSEYLIKNLVASTVDEISNLIKSFNTNINKYCANFKCANKEKTPEELRETFETIAEPLREIYMNEVSFDDNVRKFQQVLNKLSPALGNKLSKLKETLKFFDLLQSESLYIKKDLPWNSLWNAYFDIKKFTTVEKEPKPQGLELEEKRPKYAAALALDGGGIRGYMQALWLDYLEKKTNKRTYQLFDRIDGTSIGGILSLGLTYPDVSRSKPALSTQDLIHLFTEKGTQIFPQRWKYNYLGKLWDLGKNLHINLYDPGPLEQLLKSYFGEEMTFDSLLKPVGVVSADALKNEPRHLMNSDPQEKKLKLWEVGRATSAAPTYFPAYSCYIGGKKVQLIDGGLYRNNPSQLSKEALFNTKRINFPSFSHDNLIVLSLGTGEIPSSVLPGGAGKIPAVWNARIINAQMDICSRGVHESMAKLLSSTNYARINPTLNEVIDLAAATDANFAILHEAAASMYEKIDDFIGGDNSNFRHIIENLD